MKISLIAAASENNVIGKHNKLVWNLPTDFSYYKETVRHKVIIMGRKTAQSPDFFFSEKRNIVVTRQKGFHAEGLEVKNSLKEALASVVNEEEVFITGGSQIYTQALQLADKIYLTRVHGIFDGDAFFPEFDLSEWKIVKEEFHKANQQNSHDFTFFVYERA